MYGESGDNGGDMRGLLYLSGRCGDVIERMGVDERDVSGSRC